MRSARALLSGLIDYAGLYPPASLTMTDAVRSYTSHAAGPDRDILGRFVVPASRLEEFSAAASAVLPGEGDGPPWRLTVISDIEPILAREAMLQFNCSHWERSEAGHAVCDSVEIRIADESGVGRAIDAIPDFFRIFLEVPVTSDGEALIAAMAGTRAAAKARTGGVTPDAIPAAGDVLGFMQACRRHGVPFKATAGLHHALRSRYPLTYEAGSPEAVMFGYLNIFLAAVFLHAGSERDLVLRILEERNPASFELDESGVAWRGHRIGAEQVEHVRKTFALSFGSCSFTEPVAEARALGLL